VNLSDAAIESWASSSPLDRATLCAGRREGARGGRLAGEALSGAAFEDGTLLFAARWTASPAGPYTEVFRFEPSGRRCLIVDTRRGQRLAHWLHRFDCTELTPIEWTGDLLETTICWTEQDGTHELHLEHPGHVGFELVSAALRRLPDRWLLHHGLTRISARLLGPVLGIGAAPFLGRTETGVPVHLMARRLRPVRHRTYTRGGHSAGDGVEYLGGVPLGDLSFTRRPVLAQGELWFVPPPAQPAQPGDAPD
jgi:hypothetical protein